MNSKHLGYFEDPFEKAFGKKKKVREISQSQEEIDLVRDFQKLRINDNFHQVKKQQKEMIITPTLSKILRQSPLSDQTLNENGEIDFESMIHEHPIVNECIADDIDRLNELNTPLINESNKVVVGVFENIVERIPQREYFERSRPLPQYMDDDDDLDHIPKFPDEEVDEEDDEDDDDEKYCYINTNIDHNFNAVSSSDESSDPDSNSETEGAYPSDDDSDKNSNSSDNDFEN